MKLDDLKIRTRLLAAFGLIALLMLAAALAGSWGTRSVLSAFRTTLHGDLRLAQLANYIHRDVLQLRRFEKDMLINIGAAGRRASYGEKWEQALQSVQKSCDEARQLAPSESQRALDDLARELDVYAVGFREVRASIEGRSLSTTAEANAVMERHKASVHHVEELVTQIDEDANERAARVEDELNERGAAVLGILAMLTAASLTLATVVALLITRSIARPLQTAVALANNVAGGRLGHGVVCERRDELGQLLRALQRMDTKLVEIIDEVRSGAQAVNAASTELAENNGLLSQRTQEQAASLEQTAAAIEEMTANVHANAHSAERARGLAQAASTIAAAGGETVMSAVSAMDAINAASRRIADIIGVIDEIAFQTNLLALNAAVEAARAGEQGRGFAVVAGEVRSLAQRSADAAKEVKRLIGDSVDKVGAGSRLVTRSGEQLTDIVQNVRRVSEMVSEIASATSQQAAGITQLSDALSQLDSITQQNAASTEEIANTSKLAHEQSERLAERAAYFRLHGQGSGAHAEVQVAARPAQYSAAAERVPLEARYGT